MKKFVIVAMLLLAIGCVFAQVGQTIQAENLSSYAYTFDEDIVMRVEVYRGLDDLREVRLRYRKINTLEYDTQVMSQSELDPNWWEVTIPRKAHDNSDMQYYFEFILNDMRVEIMPWEFNTVGPYYMVSGAMKGRVEPGFMLLTTDADVSQDQTYLLAVSYLGISEQIDPNSIKVYVNNKDVTGKAVIEDNTIIYRNEKPVGGLTKAVVTADMNGEKVQSPTWVTTVTGRDRIKLGFGGSLNFASNYYDYDFDSPIDSKADNTESDWAAWGDVYGSAGKATLLSSVYYSSLEDENKQRINRYTVGMKIPHLQVFAGDYSPNLSNFSMSNRNVYGLYGKLYMKYLGLEVTAGQMVRNTVQEAIYNGNQLVLPASGTFKQEALGARLRMGSEQGFTFSINATRNRDIISSLDPAYYSYTMNGETYYTVTPKDNLVLSTDIRLNIPAQNIMIGAEVAGSLLNNNTIGGAITSDELEVYASDLDFIDPEALEDIFVINRNMEPIMPSMNNLAAMAYFRTFFWNNLFNVNYSVTGSAFNALSTYYQRNDTQVLSFTDQFTIGRVLTLSGGYNVTSDNFSDTYAEMNRNDTWYVQGLLRLPWFPYLKASYFNSKTENENNPDVQANSLFIPFERNATNLSFGMGFNLKKLPILPTSMDVTFRTTKDDKTTNNAAAPDYENYTNSINISMNNSLSFMPLRTQFAFSLANPKNPDDLEFDDLKDENYSLYGRVELALFKKSIIPYVQYRLVNNITPTTDQSYTYYTGGLELYPWKSFAINTDVTQRTFENLLDPTQDKDIMTWRLLLTQRF